jgi:anhydro-N-acetylmuramic acid kinase
MRVVGLISGTSYDAIDVAAAEFVMDGDELRLRPLGHLDVPHEPAVRAAIAATLPPATTSAEALCQLDTRLGQAFGAAAARGVAELCGGRADLVASHGQTVYHWVSGGHALGTLQLGQPAWIAEATGLPVVSDLRARDIARGGHGAPLVPVFDTLLLPPGPAPRAALNLGGIANMTVIRPDGSVFAYDLGPANALADAAAQALTGAPYDEGGRLAAAGTVHAGLLAALLAEPYYAAPPPKSTGKELFHVGYLKSHLDGLALPVEDVLATVTELTARVVAADCSRYGVAEVIASGGGTRNPILMGRIAALGDYTVRTIDEVGVPSDAKEAYAFALLGWLTWHQLPGALPAATGARSPAVLGSITPGATPLTLPAQPTFPRQLVVL